ncbi:MAG: hypothetical protein ABL907_15215 [Hyphomicrobium sp.]
MAKYVFLILSLFFVIPAAAAEMSAETITKSIEAIASDPAKITAYCAMAKKMDEVGEDDKKAEAAGDEIDGFFKVLGSDFEAAWNGAQEAPEESPQGKAFEAAMTKLEEKCK